ncbi:protein ygaM [Salmonella enterica subsp. arizonae]|nr:protein ygaM [Salmonella enterica subsp. arizonae]
MLNKPNRNDVDDGVQDIQNDVNRLADSLEDVLKSWGSDVKDEAETARRKAQALLKETRARMHGRTRVKQAACDAMGCADTFVREKPWCSVGTAAAVGIFIGALLSLRR